MNRIEIITLLVRIAILVITGIIIPALKKWIDAKSENEAIATIKEWSYTVVWAAEQLHKKVEHDDPDGTLRRKYAYEAIDRMAFKLGIALTSDEIYAMIESAVYGLNLSNTPQADDSEKCYGFSALEKEEDHES